MTSRSPVSFEPDSGMKSSPRKLSNRSFSFSHTKVISPPSTPRKVIPRIPKKNLGSNEVLQNINSLCDILDNADFSKYDWSNSFIKPGKLSLFSQDEELSSPLVGSSNKWIKRECPATFPSERLKSAFIAHSLKETISEISIYYPEYFVSQELDESKAEPLKYETQVWLHMLSECIQQVSFSSKSIALLLEGMRRRFADLFEFLVGFVKTEKKIVEVEKAAPPVDEKILKDNEDLKALSKGYKLHIECLNREIERLESENKQLHLELYQSNSKKTNYELQIQDLVEFTSELRQQLAESEQKIIGLSQGRIVFEKTGNLGLVPPDIISIWEQVSGFMSLLNDGVMNTIDLSQYFPEVFKSDFVPPYFTLPKKIIRVPNPEDLHFTTFFSLIRSFASENELSKLHTKFESSLRTILNTVVNFYIKRFSEFKVSEGQIVKKLTNTLNRSRSEKRHTFSWVTDMMNCSEYITKPKSAQSIPLTSLFGLIIESNHNLLESYKPPLSICEGIIKSFRNPTEIFMLIYGIEEGLGKDIACDMMKKFLLNEFPLHSFLFYCDLLYKTRTMKPTEILSYYFGYLGWHQSIEKTEIEETYCESPSKFPIVALSIYHYSIEKIQKQDLYLPENGSIDMFVENLSLNPKDAFAVSEFIHIISDRLDHPMLRDFAVILFWKRYKFDKLLLEYRFSSDPLYEFVTSYGTKKKQGKRKKSG